MTQTTCQMNVDIRSILYCLEEMKEQLRIESEKRESMEGRISALENDLKTEKERTRALEIHAHKEVSSTGGRNWWDYIDEETDSLIDWIKPVLENHKKRISSLENKESESSDEPSESSDEEREERKREIKDNMDEEKKIRDEKKKQETFRLKRRRQDREKEEERVRQQKKCLASKPEKERTRALEIRVHMECEEKKCIDERISVVENELKTEKKKIHVGEDEDEEVSEELAELLAYGDNITPEELAELRRDAEEDSELAELLAKRYGTA